MYPPRTARTPLVLPASLSGVTFLQSAEAAALPPAEFHSCGRCPEACEPLAAQTFKGGTSGVKAESCTVGQGSVNTVRTQRDCRGSHCGPSCEQAAVDVQREIWSGHSALLCETKGWRIDYVCRFLGHIPDSGNHRTCRKPVGEGASLRLDAGRRMGQREKRRQASLGQYSLKIQTTIAIYDA